MVSWMAGVWQTDAAESGKVKVEWAEERLKVRDWV